MLPLYSPDNFPWRLRPRCLWPLSRCKAHSLYIHFKSLGRIPCRENNELSRVLYVLFWCIRNRKQTIRLSIPSQYTVVLYHNCQGLKMTLRKFDNLPLLSCSKRQKSRCKPVKSGPQRQLNGIKLIQIRSCTQSYQERIMRSLASPPACSKRCSRSDTSNFVFSSPRTS